MKLKIRPEHLKQLAEIIQPGSVGSMESYRNNGLSEIRWLWDHIWSVPLARRQPFFDAVYVYANDDHITSALRHVLLRSPK